MANLLMITGLGSAKDLASDRKGAFYYTLEEFHKYWDRIDIIAPRITNYELRITNLFGNIYIHHSPFPLFLHPLFFVYKILTLNRKIKFKLMTVQEFPPFYNGIGAWIVSVLAKIPYVLEIHHIPGYPKAGNIKENIYRRLTSLFIRFDVKRAKAVRVVNQQETPNFLIKAGVPSGKIIYVPSVYVDLSVFKPRGLAKEYDVIFVGRIVENKGIDLFIEAVKKNKTRAIVVGNGPLAENLRRKIKNENLENQITFHGWAKNQNEIAELLNKSKILIMPSFNEGGPRVVVEALACGVPVLATNVGIVPDLLKNGRGGEIISWNPDDIARKVSELLNSSDKYQSYSHSGPEIAKQFERNSAIRNYAEKLQNLIS